MSDSSGKWCGGFSGKCLLILVRVALIAVILLIGVFGMKKLASLRKPPVRQRLQEPVYQAEAIRVAPEDVVVNLDGFGTVRSRRRVNISPEVSGRIIQHHSRLQVGEIVPQGEILFQIDPRDYEVALLQAKAEVDRLKAERERLRTSQQNDSKRLEIARRSSQLMESDFLRVKGLFEQDQVGTKAGVEQAERQFNQQREAVVILENALALYPTQLAENQARQQSAEAAHNKARVNLERATVKAEFTARIAFEDVEVDQVVSPGRNLVTLVDDSVLEIPVSLDSREAQRWLPFISSAEGSAWFELESQPEVSVRWVQDNSDRDFLGRLIRVEDYDSSTRTIVVIVEIRAEDQVPNAAPLVEGMFCRVQIPGRVAQSVYRLPASSVSHEGFVVRAKESRISTRNVEVILRKEQEVLVSGGLEPGDIVVTSRLAKIIDGASLELTFAGTDKEQEHER